MLTELVSHLACFATLVQIVLARITRSLTKLALEVHWTSNLSEFPLRVAFARYALCAQAGRRAARGSEDWWNGTSALSARAFLRCCGTFAGKFPGFVAVLTLLLNICGRFFSGKCSYIRAFMEHSPEILQRLFFCRSNAISAQAGRRVSFRMI